MGGGERRGRLGVLRSLETGEAGEQAGSGVEGKLDESRLLTDPDQAADFVARTGVDALAIACGTSHGACKFSRKPDGEILAMRVIGMDELAKRFASGALSPAALAAKAA